MGYFATITTVYCPSIIGRFAVAKQFIRKRQNVMKIARTSHSANANIIIPKFSPHIKAPTFC